MFVYYKNLKKVQSNEYQYQYEYQKQYTYLHTYLHTYIPTYLHTSIRTRVHTYTCPFARPFHPPAVEVDDVLPVCSLLLGLCDAAVSLALLCACENQAEHGASFQIRHIPMLVIVLLFVVMSK